MKVITKKFRIILLLVCTFLLSTISFGQIKFDDEFLKIQDGIASSTKYNNVVNYMKDHNYKLDSKEIDEEDDSEYFNFTGSYNQIVIVNYSKNKDLMFIKSSLLSLNVVFCELELENKKFLKLSTTNQEYKGEKWTETQWGKSFIYPFQFMFEKTSDKITWMYLYTAKDENFK